MLEKIKSILSKNHIEKFDIIEENENTLELFFVKKEMTLKRMKNDVTYDLTLYNEYMEDNEKYLGSASILIFPTMEDIEIEEKIKNAFNSIKFVKNKYYEMPKNVKADVREYNLLDNMDFRDIAESVVEAIYRNDINTDYFINSAEVFISKKDIHIVSNSNDVKFTRSKISGEIVCQCKEPEDVELFNIFEYDDLLPDSLAREVEMQLENVKKRSIATKEIKSTNMNVMLSGKCIRDIFDFYIYRSSASFIYNKYSDYEIGKDVQNANGDKISIELLPQVPYDYECIKKEKKILMEDGICKNIVGNARFSYYLGLTPIGNYNKIEVNTGSMNNEDLKDTYLEAIYFSNLQVDPLTGYFGGEIRLAILHKNGKEIPVTGCSISGNLVESQKDIKLSNTIQSFDNYIGPDKILFKNISISGV